MAEIRIVTDDSLLRLYRIYFASHQHAIIVTVLTLCEMGR